MVDTRHSPTRTGGWYNTSNRNQAQSMPLTGLEAPRQPAHSSSLQLGRTPMSHSLKPGRGGSLGHRMSRHACHSSDQWASDYCVTCAPAKPHLVGNPSSTRKHKTPISVLSTLYPCLISTPLQPDPSSCPHPPPASLFAHTIALLLPRLYPTPNNSTPTRNATTSLVFVNTRSNRERLHDETFRRV